MSERRVEFMALSGIKGAKRNPKDHDVGELSKSVGRFGFAEVPLLDERTGLLVAGHGRIKTLQALKDGGAAPPEGVRLKGKEWLVPVLRGWASRSDADAEAYLVASNRLTELGGWSDVQLVEMLKDLARLDALEGSGFDAEDIGHLLSRVEGVPLPELPTGEKPPTTQMTFVLSEAQAEAVRLALSKAQEKGLDKSDGVNLNGPGNALAGVATSFLMQMAVVDG